MQRESSPKSTINLPRLRQIRRLRPRQRAIPVHVTRAIMCPGDISVNLQASDELIEGAGRSGICFAFSVRIRYTLHARFTIFNFPQPQ